MSHSNVAQPKPKISSLMWSPYIHKNVPDPFRIFLLANLDNISLKKLIFIFGPQISRLFFIFKRRNIELFLFPGDFNFLGNLTSPGNCIVFWFSREVYKIHECVGGYTRLCVGVYKPVFMFTG